MPTSIPLNRLRATDVAGDLRHAWRAVRQRPGFLAIAVLSLGLAISLNTVMYSVLDALLNPVIDLRRPDQLYKLRYYGNTTRRLDRAALLNALQSGRHTYEGVSGYSVTREALVERESRLQQAAVYAVRPDFLGLLGVRPIAGRVFVPSDASSPTCSIVISDRLAAELFLPGETRAGNSVRVNGSECTVLGVIPRYITIPALDADLWRLPTPKELTIFPINLIRLRAGVTPQLAGNELAVLAARLAAEAGESRSETRFDLKPWFAKQFRSSFGATYFHYALIAAVLAVLLVACANLANLQLARGIGRNRELATRAAVGATRSRLIRHLLAETTIVAGAGLVLGLILTYIGVHLLTATIPDAIADYIVTPHTSWRMFAFAALIALVCIVLVGLAPAVRVSRVDPNELLKSGAGTGAHKRNTRLYGWLIIAEVGLSLALLSGAVVLVRAAHRLGDRTYLAHAIYGFDPTPLIQVTLGQRAAPNSHVPMAEAAARMVSEMRAVRGVTDAAFHVGLRPENDSVSVIDAFGFTKEVPAPLWTVAVVSPSYFSTRGLPIIKGRGFVEAELDSRAVIVDVPTAKFLWPKADPIGQLIKFGGRESNVPWSRVVGVVGDLLDRDRYDFPLGDWPRLLDVYRVVSVGDTIPTYVNGRYMLVADVRTSRDPDRVAVALRHALMPGAVEGRLDVETLNDAYHITRERTRRAFVASLFTVFATVALMLATIGVYGLVAHSVAERRREIGVRIALGATWRDVLHALLREGNVLVLAGIALGLWLTAQTVGWLGMFLGWGDNYDAVLFATVAAALFLVVVIAAVVPGMRATRIDPVEALRAE